MPNVVIIEYSTSLHMHLLSLSWTYGLPQVEHPKKILTAVDGSNWLVSCRRLVSSRNGIITLISDYFMGCGVDNADS